MEHSKGLSLGYFLLRMRLAIICCWHCLGLLVRVGLKRRDSLSKVINDLIYLLDFLAELAFQLLQSLISIKFLSLKPFLLEDLIYKHKQTVGHTHAIISLYVI
jgi:hypothetical protein